MHLTGREALVFFKVKDIPASFYPPRSSSPSKEQTALSVFYDGQSPIFVTIAYIGRPGMLVQQRK
jgi:hypothetical protein